MDKQRWQNIVAAFTAVSGKPAILRDELLDVLCAGDMSLRNEVASLLEAHALEVDLLPSATGMLSEIAPVDLEGKQIGAYHLQRCIAGGGMGDVYLAQRRVDGVEQNVAFKVVQRRTVSTPALQRFLRERRILASFDHPNISRLLDAGVTDDGRPYLVMPYLEGALPITLWCDQRRQNVRDRVALFEKVCAAVHYAHQHLVVHADLKPGNILVTPLGEPMLLDFGISRLLGATEDGTQTNLMVAEKQRPLTPGFASPEQLRGQAPTTASDVYSLGIILFELMCGDRPYKVDRVQPEKTLEEINIGTARPSARASANAELRDSTPRRLRDALRGDIDNITARALNIEPAKRYGSALALAEDLQRWAHGMPVQAHAPSRRYQLRKFVGRHRMAVTATVVATGGLILFAVAMAMQANQISQQAHDLRVERDRAEAMVRFMTDLFNTTNPMLPEGGAPSAEQMLDRGIRQSAVLGEGERMTALTVIGGAYIGLGRYENARRALTEALRLQPESARTLERAAMLRELATLEYRLDQLETGDQLAQRALDIASDLLPPDDSRLSPYLNAAGMTAMDSGRTEESEQLLTRAISLRRGRPGYEANQEYADSLRALGDVLHTVERFDEAGAYYDEAVAVYERAAGPTFAMIAITLNNQSAMLRKQGRVEDALSGYRRAREIALPSFGDQHPFVGVVTNNIARLSLRLGKFDDAHLAFAQALESNRAALPSPHPTLARSLDGLGESLLLLGQPDAAVAPLREAVQMFADSGRGESGEALETQLLLAQALIDSGEQDRGMEALTRGLAQVWPRFGTDDPTRQRYQSYLDGARLDAETLLAVAVAPPL